VSSPFTNFPRGWPGLGLLLLRLVVGVTVAVQGWRAIESASHSAQTWGTAGLAITLGIAVVAGFLTPAAAALLGIGTIGVAFGRIPWSDMDPLDREMSMIFVSICAAIGLLGPGALSIDARLRGRREIVIPANHHARR
jgi:uncharacterized membrane protein YphA (DoxX/SURF4 family)